MEQEKYFSDEENSEEIKKDELEPKEQENQEDQVAQENEDNKIAEEKPAIADAEDAIDLGKVKTVLDEKTLQKIKDFFSQTPDIESGSAEVEKKVNGYYFQRCSLSYRSG
ncbi:MAG: hypothetical protein V1688_00975 [bacterium]